MSDAAADAIFTASAEREVKGGGPANTDAPAPEPTAAPEPKATVELEEPPKVAPAAPPPPPVIPFPPPVAAPAAPEQRQAAPPAVAPAKNVTTLAGRIAKIQDLEIDDPLSGEEGTKVTVGELFKQNPGLFQLADALAGVHAESMSERFAEFEPMRASVERQQQQAAFETDMKHLEAPVAQGGLGIADARKIITHAGYADFLQKTPWAKAIAESGDESGFGIVLDSARKALKLEGAATPPPAPRQQRKSDIALHESTIRGGGEEQRGGGSPDDDMDDDAQEKLFQAEAKKKEDERRRIPQ